MGFGGGGGEVGFFDPVEVVGFWTPPLIDPLVLPSFNGFMLILFTQYFFWNLFNKKAARTFA